MNKKVRSFYVICGKRCLDVTLAFAALIILAPLLVITAVLVRWRLGAPVLFRQMRPGFHGKPFGLLKFRTMRSEVDASGNPLPDHQRITVFGSTLRKLSVDELPELWNVVKGDMSLVGPRPLLIEYLPLYSAEQARRQVVRPGLTGWAQINGRNSLSWPDKFKLDVWYVDNVSFLLDLKIIMKTVLKVFLREGIHAEGNVTMPRFTGNPRESTP